MDILEKHEVFEIEVLERLNSAKLLDPLVFGGGTMLRLCHELNRYSVDLDFWFVRKTAQKVFFDQLLKNLGQDYEITDAQAEHFTLLVEIRTGAYPKRLKIEIRRQQKKSDYQTKIAFSRFSTRQVLLKAHSLEQTMKNKIEALLDRGEIRDCFDIEFVLRRGTALPELSGKRLNDLLKKAAGFKDRDFKVKLGGIVDNIARAYYIQNQFSYLIEKLSATSSGAKG
jgi:predicted nucleotidyltransferase component of viral defense system